MVQNRALTPDGDLLYQDGRQVMISDREAIAQGVWISIVTVQGDDQFFPRFGLNKDAMTGKSEDERLTELREGLLRSGRIRRVISIDLPDTPDRRRRFQYIVRAVDRNEREVTLGVNLGA